MQEYYKASEKLANTLFKDYEFKSWEAGLNSTERRNVARLKKLLNTLDELNRNNIKNDVLFRFISSLIKDVLAKQYIIKCKENTYSIKKKVQE